MKEQFKNPTTVIIPGNLRAEINEYQKRKEDEIGFHLSNSDLIRHLIRAGLKTKNEK